jgi:hypothetical protein
MVMIMACVRVVSLLAVLLTAPSPGQPPESIRLQPGSAITVAPAQATTIVCEAALTHCVCTYNRRPGEFSYELNWIAPTLPPITTTLARYWDRQDCLVAMRQAPECQR